MPISLLDAFFRPRSIAILGASDNPAKLSGRPLDFLLRLGYVGDVYAINASRREVQGQRAYSSLLDVPGPVDLVIVAVPVSSVLQALSDCVAKGVSGAIIFASGFAELNAQQGRELQGRIRTLAQGSGLRVMGPNCLGTFSVPNGAFATFSSAFDELQNVCDDPVAIVSQSGAVGTYLFTTLQALGVGVRYYANTGNQADVTVSEVIAALAQADDISILIGYLEDGTQLDQLSRAAAIARCNGKPLFLLKSGVTREGARAIGFHTGSTAGNEDEFDAVVKQSGAMRVECMEHAADLALMFRPQRMPTGRRLAIVTSSGGCSALSTDAAIKAGLTVDAVSPAAEKRLRRIMPHYGSAANPIDLTGSLLNDASMLEISLREIISDPLVDMVLVVLGNAEREAMALVEGIASNYVATEKPFAISWTGGSGHPRQMLLSQKIPTYSEPLRAVRALAGLADYSLNHIEHSEGIEIGS